MNIVMNRAFDLHHTGQDLRDNPSEVAAYFYNKRGWLRWKSTYKEILSWQAVIRRRINGNWFNCEVTLGGEDTQSVKLHLGFLWFKYFLTVNHLLPKRWQVGWYTIDGTRPHAYAFEESHGRGYGLDLYQDHLVISWGASQIGSGRGKGWGFTRSWFLKDTIFGRMQHSSVLAAEHLNQPIWFPEATNHVNITLSNDSWWYPRWPFWPLNRHLVRAHLEVIEKSGIPVPGKGENSYDCGDTATHGLTCPATNICEALNRLRGSVNETRARYGSGEMMYVNVKVKGSKNGTEEGSGRDRVLSMVTGRPAQEGCEKPPSLP